MLADIRFGFSTVDAGSKPVEIIKKAAKSGEMKELGEVEVVEGKLSACRFTVYSSNI